MISHEDIQENERAILSGIDIDCLDYELVKIEKAMKAINTISQTLVMLAHARGSQESRVSLPDGILINNFVSDNRVIIGLAAALDLLSSDVWASEDYISTTIARKMHDNKGKKEDRP